MDMKRYEQRLKIMLNEPGLFKHYLERNSSQNSKTDKFKTIFPPIGQIQRFHHLEQARLSAQRDVELDAWVSELIKKFQAKLLINSRVDREIQSKKQNCLDKLKMDYVEQQMSQHLIELQKLIGDYKYYNELINSERGYVEKMINMTEIKKALQIQNNILKKQNEMLKKQEEEIDTLLNSKKKK